MSEEKTVSVSNTPRRAPRRGRFGWWMLFTNLIALVALIYGVLALSSRVIPLPNWAAERAEARISASITPARADVGGMTFAIDRDGTPRVAATDVTLLDAGGAIVARLNDFSARVSTQALMAREIAPSQIRLGGAQITVRRDVSGTFALSFGGDSAAEGATSGDIIEALDLALSAGPLRYLERVVASEVTISLEDARSGRIWQASNALASLDISAESFNTSLITEVFNGTDQLAELQLSASTNRDTATVALGARMSGMPAADLALQSPALSFLGVIDADIDGSLRAEIGSEGELRSVAASLDIGVGAISPNPGAIYAFDRATAYLTYDPNRERIEFSEISMVSDLLSVAGEGHAYLRDMTGAWPERLIGQVRLSEAQFNAADLLPEAVSLDTVVADFSLKLAPFELRFGQIVAESRPSGAEPRRLSANGYILGDERGWTTALDLASERLSPADVLALWPPTAAKGARVWVARNVLGGALRKVSGALRISPDAPPDVALRFDLEDANVRFMDHFPPIENGSGWASISGDTYTMYLDHGTVPAEQGGDIDLAGSTFRIDDMRPKFPVAVIDLKTKSSLEAALSVLDNRPFEILQTSGLAADVADARAESSSRITLELNLDIKKEDVAFQTTGVLSDVASERLRDGLRLVSSRLSVEIDEDALVLSGRGVANGVPITARWEQGLSDSAAGQSTLEAQISLSPATLAALGVESGALNLSGAAPAQLAMTLPSDGPVQFQLQSQLDGLSASMPPIGWSKAAGASGNLTIAGQLDETLTISQMDISAPGLVVSGVPLLRADGSLEGLDLDTLRIGSWFVGSPRVLLPSPNSNRLAVLGGTVDLRSRPRDTPRASGGAPTIELALDEMIISDTIALRPFTARLPGNGQSGRFDAQVNGRTAIDGDLVPQPTGLGLRIRSANGGAALSDARILPGAEGGDLLVTLVSGATPGSFEGQLEMRNTRLRDAPTAALLLDAFSIVGLIDELNGSGIHFDTVGARFWLGPDELRLFRSSAVGPSLGISLDGTYDLAAKTMDLQGVVSPFYLVNGLGAVLTRRGEGLFGMNFRMRGAASDPDVSINPLSILTPGMFREIFRRPPPQADPATQTQ